MIVGKQQLDAKGTAMAAVGGKTAAAKTGIVLAVEERALAVAAVTTMIAEEVAHDNGDGRCGRASYLRRGRVSC